ncbi:hypothetical protein MMC30_004633 [Trapelia coarctata]|nr:hypothetical protein [Trapelia coarctata]
MFSTEAPAAAPAPKSFVQPKSPFGSAPNQPDDSRSTVVPLKLRSFAKRLSSSYSAERPPSRQTTLTVNCLPLQSLDQHPAIRSSTPRHVPIIITRSIVESVLKDLPDSPDSEDGLERPIPPSVYKGLQGHIDPGIQIPKRPRHIPIIIPEFAQPYGSFPPTPSDSECGTPQPLGPALSGPSTPPPNMARPATNGSRTSTLDSSVSAPSPSRIQAGQFQPPTSNYPTDVNSSMQSTNYDTSQEPAYHLEQAQRSFQAADASSYTLGPMSAGAQQSQAMAGNANLSGLVCNVHKCTGKEPHALVGATTTVLGDKLYIFGGRRLSRRRPQLTADLYELDLLRRHWTKLETSGDIPPPRYFHSVCALGDRKLVCYGGMSPASSQVGSPKPASVDQQPEVVVMSDIHVYDVGSRTWTFIPTTDNPQGRYAHCATILPSSAVFSSANAPLSAMHHNPSSGNPHQGSLGVALDGTGGAEMVVVGGQDSANHYIEQISVFNLRSLKWTATQSLGRSCGAYRSVVAPLTGMSVSRIGFGPEPRDIEETSREVQDEAASMLIYSNYNFLDVKLELQIRLPDGSLTERPMQGQFSPPGLRFPNGGVLDRHFVVSGTYLTSSKQEYALWALDLRNLTWSRIDSGGSVFSQGSWNRGVLWPRRNTFVILGNRKRNLVEDYNHRRINFSNICMVELEAFGLYDNPRHATPTSAYTSFSAPKLPLSLRPKTSTWSAGGRPHFAVAEELGQMAMGLRELADMDILSISGDRIPANSHLLARRWGPYFVHLLREAGNANTSASNPNDSSASEVATLRAPHNTSASRNSSVTITPSLSSIYSSATIQAPTSATSTSTLTSLSLTNSRNNPSSGTALSAENSKPFHPPTCASLPPATRSRTLFLPHTPLTIKALLHYLYTSSLPPPSNPLSTPQILCSLLQLARPYHVDGLLEAVVERLHEVMDGRNAAAVFNASAMAAGGGRGTGFDIFKDLNLSNGFDAAAALNGSDPIDHTASHVDEDGFVHLSSQTRLPLRINTSFQNATRTGPHRSRNEIDESEDEGSRSSAEGSKASSVTDGSDYPGDEEEDEIWSADGSCVVGVQKRGLRGLMEGRRMRERGRSVGQGGGAGGEGVEGRVGLGIA